MRTEQIFVSTDWLAQRLGAADLIVIDGSWYLPAMNRDPLADYLAAHIPGAVYFDIDTVKDAASPLPHMMPSPDDFARMAGALGIGDGMTAVVYDGAGLFSAPRVRWMLQTMGLRDTFILEGGLPRWLAEGRATENGAVTPAARVFTPRFDRDAIAGVERIAATLENGAAQIIDARPAERFRGEAAEPRQGVRSGHMPGSFNMPSSSFVENGTLKSDEAIAALFRVAQIDPARPTITSCGSGVSAAIVSIAMERLGHPPLAIYDGSWSEWGADPSRPLATGPA
ncbi:MAG: 3-mercaptopyruvate sulfurtransferase [Beijerinckiaceae bacterium]